MADNYLERRMEDMHSGRLARENSARSKSASDSAAKGFLRFRIGSRKILIVSDIETETTALASAFVKGGCKVAVMTACRETGRRLAHDTGVRYCEADMVNAESIRSSFSSLMEGWRQLDILITVESADKVISEIGAAWRAHRAVRPSTGSYFPRMMIISGGTGSGDAPRPEDLPDDTAIYHICAADTDPATIATTSTAVQMLAIPAEHPMASQTIYI